MYRITLYRNDIAFPQEWEFMDNVKEILSVSYKDYDKFTIERFENLERIAGFKNNYPYSIKERVLIDKYTLAKQTDNSWKTTQEN